jgi:tripartite-type tricarboxylate transporter receptor subunit TctC
VIVFSGDGEAISAVLGGHAMIAGVISSVAIPHLRVGKLKVLATTADKRWDAYPEVPTLLELGFKDYCPDADLGFYGRKGLPDPIVKKLVDAFKKTQESPAF